MRTTDFVNVEIDIRGDWNMYMPPGYFDHGWRLTSRRSGSFSTITGYELLTYIEQAKKERNRLTAAITDMEAKVLEVMEEQS